MLLSITQQPDIFLFGLRINEPITTISDFLITAACLFAYYSMKTKSLPSKFNLYMQYYFLLMAIATFWGGLFGHGFQYILGFYGRLPGWYIGMISIMLIERASIENVRRFVRPKIIKVLLIVNIIEFIIMAALTTFTLDFIYVQVHSAYGILVVVFSFHLYAYIKSKEKGSKETLIGVAIVSFAAFVYNYPIVINIWFNNLDFAHVLMAIATFFILKGSLSLQGNSSYLEKKLDFGT